MVRTTLALAALLAGAALPAAAQGTLRPGQTVRGDLDSGDSALDDGSLYDMWEFQAQAGRTYVVTMRSDDFDTYLAVGPVLQPGCTDCVTDDDGDGGTNSRVAYRATRAGTVQIRANALSEGEIGAYSLSLEDAGESAPEAPGEGGMSEVDGVTVREIRMGETVRGELSADDPADEDGSHFDLYTYTGQPGESITVTLRSDAFDAFLMTGAVVGDDLEDLGADDDSAGGTDAQVTLTVPAGGQVMIVANSYVGDQTGAYTLEITRGG
jgi:hypothetical protein